MRSCSVVLRIVRGDISSLGRIKSNGIMSIDRILAWRQDK